MRAAVCAGVLLLVSFVRACSTEDAAGDAPARDDAAIVYLLATDLPDGWTIRMATERPNPIPDYTVSWSPLEFAGRNRAAALAAPDEGPRLFVNVGARAYGEESGSLVANVEDASVERNGDVLGLDFLSSGSPVSVGGRGVTEDELRAFATSLRAIDHEAWREQLGDRLLVDDSP